MIFDKHDILDILHDMNDINIRVKDVSENLRVTYLNSNNGHELLQIRRSLDKPNLFHISKSYKTHYSLLIYYMNIVN